jgi:hypothetical protein
MVLGRDCGVESAIGALYARSLRALRSLRDPNAVHARSRAQRKLRILGFPMQQVCIWRPPQAE